MDAVTADPTPEEQDAPRSVATAIWTPELAGRWTMNNDLADVPSTATDSILRCSEAFSLVPKPPGFVRRAGIPGEVRAKSRRLLPHRARHWTYRVCVVNTARNYRTAIERASEGV
ncbi:hypothetical protein [Kibdelosporangium phytohabitans]|uniref:Uncharacterized protein n=1 Tax=Kibdelosporangium phytohabitans TaxID=860235 RepID=A0A0N9HY42_9PSEU|nr:hypothetical protein [Kibdelosporangium phytohabitans]ALG12234.1 hypothetical protein AOZ06_40040 [Kibdelosporangium phytohabitans]MBE1463771.1 hypothetical protein [Kibdelosporangium phytohabitans]